MTELLLGIVVTVAMAWLGSMEWRLKNLNTRLIGVPDREEVITLISIHNRSLEVEIEALRADINRLIISVEKLHER